MIEYCKSYSCSILPFFFHPSLSWLDSFASSMLRVPHSPTCCRILFLELSEVILTPFRFLLNGFVDSPDGVFSYIYIYIYIYLYTYIYIFISLYIYTYTYIYICTLQKNWHQQLSIMESESFLCFFLYKHVFIYIYIYIHIYTKIYEHTFIYINKVV